MSFTGDQSSRVKEQVTINLSSSTRNRGIAKCLTILLFGFAFGYFYHQDYDSRLQKVEQLTKEQYIADFEIYKAKLREQAIPPSIAPLIGILAACLLYGSYELLVTLVSWMMGKILK
jgi:hypothetical protein